METPFAFFKKLSLLLLVVSGLISFAFVDPSHASETRGDPSQLFSASGANEDYGFTETKTFRGIVDGAVWIMRFHGDKKSDTFTVTLFREIGDNQYKMKVLLTGRYETFYRDKWHLDSSMGVFVDGYTKSFAEDRLMVYGVLTEGGRMYEFNMYPPMASVEQEIARIEEKEKENFSPIRGVFSAIDNFFGFLQNPFKKKPQSPSSQEDSKED